MVAKCGQTETNELNFAGMEIYPNPFSENLTVRGNGLTSISVYNILGEQVHEDLGVFSNKPIDLNYLKSGIYLVKLQNNSGECLAQKIIKE
jgi:hypothetical protein